MNVRGGNTIPYTPRVPKNYSSMEIRYLIQKRGKDKESTSGANNPHKFVRQIKLQNNILNKHIN